MWWAMCAGWDVPNCGYARRPRRSLWYGVYKSGKPEENRKRLLTLLSWLPSLPFAGDATRHFGEIRAFLSRRGTPIGPYDVQIAAIAHAHGLIVVTHNTGEFERVPGLALEDWQK